MMLIVNLTDVNVDVSIQTLREYGTMGMSNKTSQIIPLAFLNIIVNPTNINFANVGDRCSKFPGTNLLKCPEIE